MSRNNLISNINNTEIYHYGVLGMRWGHHKRIENASNRVKKVIGNTSNKIERHAYKVGAKINPREFKYKVRKVTNKVNSDVKTLSDLTKLSTKVSGVLPTNKKALKAVESVGIETHSKASYNNLDKTDIKRLKTYTDSARYSRNINSYLATGSPKQFGEEANKLKETLQKNSIDKQVVYRSCNLKFSMNGVAKKLDQFSEDDLSKMFSDFSRNFNGKSPKENRIFSTSTSPLFAIDTWRSVNPTAASTYNTYMIINCNKCPGLLADGKTSKGEALVNTRSNQEAILAPNKMTYRKLEYDKKRKMFAITVDAS